MKVSEMFGFLFAVVMLSVGIVSAQSVQNPYWMYGSQSAMDLYKIQQIKSASVSLWSGASVDEINSQADAFAFNSTDDTLNVIELLKAQRLTLSVARPEQDRVGCSAWLYDKYGRGLFCGGTYESLQQIDGVWGFSKNLMKVKMFPNTECYVAVSNAVSAKTILRDEAGNIVESKYSQINERGEIVSDYNDIGRNADLAITTRDGNGQYSTSLVSLRGDSEKPVQKVAANQPDISIDGLWDYGEKMDYMDYLNVTPESYNGQGKSPILRMKVSIARSFYLFTKTTEGEEPTTVVVTDSLTGDRTEVNVVATPYGVSKHAVITLPHAGIWYITYGWASFDNQVYYSWYGDKGW